MPGFCRIVEEQCSTIMLQEIPPSILRPFDTCTLANAIETLDLRLKNEGYSRPVFECRTGRYAPIAGYAVTARIRTAQPPTLGQSYCDRTDWWSHILTVRTPRIVILQDTDTPPGRGSYVGEVHAHILRALGCEAVVTNGAVRDLNAVEEMRFPLYAGAVSVGHAYAHMTEMGGTVEIGGLNVREGDLVVVDRHGMLAVPEEKAAEIAGVAQRLQARERSVIEICKAPEFRLARLKEAMWQLP
jgi:regulator of RNase E activity RraA